MNIDKKDRSELKAYFVKNAVPTQGNFADLIDATLNQKDDGIVKPAGDPLSIEAAGDATSQKKAIHFYNLFTDANPAWVLSLNPRTAAADPATAKAGFNVADGQGVSRLFIDAASGNVGLGTLTPAEKLAVEGPARIAGGLAVGGDLRFGTIARQMVNLWGDDHGIGVQNSTTYFRSSGNFAWYKGGAHNDAERNPGGGAVQMAIDSSGRVGIGTATPTDKLTVYNGDLRITGGQHRRLKIVSDSFWTGIELVARQDGEAGHPYIDFTHGELDVTDYGVRLYASSNDQLDVDSGVLRVPDGLKVDGNRSSHVIADGSFYRYNGQVYINVDDNLYIRDSTSGIRMHFNTDNGWIYASGHGTYSDARLKKSIRRLGGCLSKVLALHGVSFRWKESAIDHGRQIGLLAQEVEEVFPELVDTDSDGVKSLSYFGLVTPLIEAIREQQAQIESLRARIEQLPA